MDVSKADRADLTDPQTALDKNAPAARRATAWIALARQEPRFAEAAFSALPVVEQRDLVLAAPVQQRLDLLHLPEDATALVQALPPLELHRTVQVVGKWEAMEVVEVASEDQINFMLDHDCWRGESLDSRKFNDWIQLFLECDDNHVFRILTAINADLLALALKKHVKFEKDFMIDDVYFLDPDWVKGSNPVVQLFLERLYSLDPNLWVRLLGWVRMHSRGTIEADAIEGREGRLRGRGFPAPSLAITVYYPVEFDVRALVENWRTLFLEGGRREGSLLPVAGAREEIFLNRVFRRLAELDNGDDRSARRESELLDVANKVMVADQVDIGDLQRQREAVDKVRRWISIGLEAASGGDVEAGVAVLRQRQTEYAFRVGAMLFDALGSAVVELEKQEQSSGGRITGSDWCPAYLALSEPEPQIPADAQAGRTRFLTTLSEYRYAWQLLWAMQDDLARRP
jgi:hypothetical protein